MRKILNKYCCVFFFLIGSFVVLAQPGLPDHHCCELLLPTDGSYNGDIDTAPQEYKDCIVSTNKESYCAVPIDNSRYIYISIVAGVALASFVIARAVERKNKKTPI